MERIGDEVKRELGRFGSAGRMAELVAAWPAAVGETVAANAWPARLARDGTLHVHAASSTWAFELQQLEAEIAGVCARRSRRPRRRACASPRALAGAPRRPRRRTRAGLRRSRRSSRLARRTSWPRRSRSKISAKRSKERRG